MSSSVFARLFPTLAASNEGVGNVRVIDAIIAACAAALCSVLAMPSARAVDKAQAGRPVATYDAEGDWRVGADERGMRKYVLVVLKTGATRVPDGAERDAMFAGHFANIERLPAAGRLALAGPFSLKDPFGWRGLYIFAVDGIECCAHLRSNADLGGAEGRDGAGVPRVVRQCRGDVAAGNGTSAWRRRRRRSL